MVHSPTSIAYHVQDTKAGENGEKRGVWTRVGAAWPQAVRASGDSTRRTSKPAGAERRQSAGRRRVCQGGDCEAWFREAGLSAPRERYTREQSVLQLIGYGEI